ncbi:MAG TPA: TlpA disulfide reductase family protein [Candidatus Polarisedimenticolia bacterium]|nr:TlpA disulfide reductase family protein [Candidatus Polarisedimenticolia bacterium]
MPPAAVLATAVLMATAPAAAPAPPDALPRGPVEVMALDGSLADLVSLAAPAGEGGPRAVLLVFWGTWCQPCIREIPVLKELVRHHGPAGLKVIGVGLELQGDTLERLSAAVSRHGIDYPVYFDHQGKAREAFGVTALPAAALVDGDGRVRWSGPALPRDINLRIQSALRPGEDRDGK